jgi:hypothetical protein
MRILSYLVLVLLAAAAACGERDTKLGQAVSDNDLMQIAEAIMTRHYYLSKPPVEGEDRPVVFVTIDGKIPSEDFLKRLSKGRVHFRPGSEYKHGLGTHLTVGNFIWTDSTHAKGDIGEVCGPLCGQGHAVVMTFADGKWLIQSLTPTWIS